MTNKAILMEWGERAFSMEKCRTMVLTPRERQQKMWDNPIAITLGEEVMEQEWESMTAGVRGLAEKARTLSSMASSAASLVTGLWTCRNGPSKTAAEKPSWIDTVLKGVRLAASVGLAFRAPADQEESK